MSTFNEISHLLDPISTKDKTGEHIDDKTGN